MDVLIIAIVAALAAALTIYSGFGLGTVMLPAFALFLPAPAAVAAAGIVHLLNNLFKGTLLRRRADWGIVLRFGLPAIPAAIAGAGLLAWLGETPRVFEWAAFGYRFGPTGAGLTVGLLVLLFGWLELQGWLDRLKAPPRFLSAGGLLAGFLGGLTGQQGAIRTIFLLHSGLSAERLVATGAMIAILVDLSRLTTYAATFAAGAPDAAGRDTLLIVTGALAAFAGSYVATRRLEKTTIRTVRYAAALLMFAIGTALTAGLIG